MKFCIQTDPDIDVRFAALKRIHLFKEHPDLIRFLQTLNDLDKNVDLEPYLSIALSRVGIITQDELQRRINMQTIQRTPVNNGRWTKFDTGSSIGTVGSEGGEVIEDFECVDGARVTIEKDGDIAPFTVTLGIYGLMFHTHFSSTEIDAKKFMDFAKTKINEIFSLYETSETARDSKWHDIHSRLISELAEQ